MYQAVCLYNAATSHGLPCGGHAEAAETAIAIPKLNKLGLSHTKLVGTWNQFVEVR